MLRFYRHHIGNLFLAQIACAVTVFIAAWLVGNLVRWVMIRRAQRYGRSMLVPNLTHYAAVAGGGMLALRYVGVNPASLLVTGGLLTVAIGFASQTTLSNVIAGVFLTTDRPFRIGDWVYIVPDVEGEVVSIDLLSTKIRTFDNIYVRVPNESLVKGVLQNRSRYPIRRLDTAIRVSTNQDLERAREALYAAAAQTRLVLVEPEPLVIIDKFDEFSISVTLRVWVPTDQWLATRDELTRSIGKLLSSWNIALGAAPTVVASATKH